MPSCVQITEETVLVVIACALPRVRWHGVVVYVALFGALLAE